MGKGLQKFATLIAAYLISVPIHANESVAACKLLSDAEIRTLAGSAVQDWQFQLPRNGTTLGGGGSECEIPGFSIQLDAATVDRYRDRMKIWSNARFEPTVGIGDEAHFYAQGSDIAGIYTRVGKRMLVVSRDLQPGETPASARPLLESVAKAIVEKLK